MALRRRSLRLRTWWCRAFIGTFVIPCTWRWCVPLWDRHCSSTVSCFSSTRELCGSCFTCSCWAMRNPHSGGSLVPHTRRTERTSGGGGRGSHRGRAPAKNDRLSGRGINSVAEQAVSSDARDDDRSQPGLRHPGVIWHGSPRAIRRVGRPGPEVQSSVSRCQRSTPLRLRRKSVLWIRPLYQPNAPPCVGTG